MQEIWEDLLDNLSYNGETLNAQEYFIGSLVLVGDDDSPRIERFIVDGQQRLMTFTIAFSVLTQIFIKEGEEKISNATYSYIMSQDSDGNEYTKLVAENPKPFFQFRIQQKEIDFTQVPSNQEEKRILDAYQFFERHLDKGSLMADIENRFPGSSEKLLYSDVLKAFRNQILACKVVYVTVKSFEDAYTIFEVLNAKGKDLTAIDIIKNSIFSILDKEQPIDMASEKWKKIRDNIAKCDEDTMTFYRHFWLSKYGFTTTKKLVKDFQRTIPKSIADYTTFITNLEKESETYSRIVVPNENEWRQPEYFPVMNALEALSIFNTSQVRTFLLALFEAKEQNKISHRNYLKALKFLEKFHFIFTAVCSSRASGLERRYSSFARRLRGCETKPESAACVNDLIFALSETLPSLEIFAQKIIGVQFTSEKTKSKRLIQYILKKLEAYFAGSIELRPNSFTIEHIIPESTKAPWVGMIGNLLPLGEALNGELRDKPFAEKMKRYPESRYSSVDRFVRDYSKNDRFAGEEINKRTLDLAGILYNEVWR